MIINVSQYNNFLKALIDNEPMLNKISVCGEVSNLRFTNESIFFSLKDAFCQMDCFAYNDRFVDGLKDGCEVIVEGNASYLKSGKVSFFVNKITYSQREGEQFKKLSALKEKLQILGFFDENRKKQLPKYIFNVGVVTSVNGAVLHDINDVIYRRNRFIKLNVFDVRVQGEDASRQIVDGIKFLDLQNLDVIIIARGGGSKEDLSAFDSEDIAIALRDCSTPVISAVGHETDFSICDFCADLRAGTPSIAAEIITNNDPLKDLTSALKDLNRAINEKFNYFNDKYVYLNRQLNNTMSVRVSKAKDYFNLLTERCRFLVTNKFNEKKSSFNFLLNKLDLISPQGVLNSGKAYVFKDGNRVVDANSVAPGDALTIYVSNGKIFAKVDEVKNGF